MLLTEIKKDQTVKIIRVNADKSLKDRLTSFGITKGENVTVKGCSLAKKTLEIEVGSTFVALRASEAKHIEVEHIPK